MVGYLCRGLGHEPYKIHAAGVPHRTTEDVVWASDPRMTPSCCDNNSMALEKLLYSCWDYGNRQPMVSIVLEGTEDRITLATALGPSPETQSITPSLTHSSLSAGLMTKVA
jgi:hypothetical protein